LDRYQRLLDELDALSRRQEDERRMRSEAPSDTVQQRGRRVTRRGRRR
jgi:hypothetical protein